MASDLVDMPPESQAIQAGLEAARDRELDARQGVLPDLGTFSVTLPAAPGSREARLSTLAEPVRVTREFFDNVVNAAWLLSMQGSPIDPEAIQRAVPAVFKPEHLETIRAVLNSEKMRLALHARGIEPDRVRANGLSPEMVAAIRVWTDPTLGLTPKQRLNGAGVSWAQWQGWQSFGPFREALVAAGEGTLKATLQASNVALAELATEGKDLKAIQYLHQITGYFTPNKQQNLDVQAFVTRVMTAVLRRVAGDQELLLALAADFRIIQEEMRLGAGPEPGAGQPGALALGFGESAMPLMDPVMDPVMNPVMNPDPVSLAEESPATQ